MWITSQFFLNNVIKKYVRSKRQNRTSTIILGDFPPSVTDRTNNPKWVRMQIWQRRSKPALTDTGSKQHAAAAEKCGHGWSPAFGPYYGPDRVLPKQHLSESRILIPSLMGGKMEAQEEWRGGASGPKSPACCNTVSRYWISERLH